MTTIQNLDLAGQHVIVRADLNVPFRDGIIENDYRLQAFLPTLAYLNKHNAASVTIITHLGRPHKGIFDATLSTKQLAGWFWEHGYNVTHAATPHEALQDQASHSLTLLENIRFFAGEKDNDLAFAKTLATLGTRYINDAFGTLHRSDASVNALPQLYARANRGIGLLVEREINCLERIRTNADKPLILVLGGAKLDDKLPLINQIMTTQPATTIMIGGALALPFLKAQGLVVGTTPVTDQAVQQARNIIEGAQAHHVTLILPTDMMIIEGQLGSPAQACAVNAIPATAQCLDVGPDTISCFTRGLVGAKTIFTNGTMGMYEYAAYAHGTQAVLQAIAAVPSCYTVAGGGNATDAIATFGLASAFSYLSTGGGATLAYLGSRDPWHELPGLFALIEPSA